MEEKIRTHILVSGRVQGVFYRKGVYQKAHELGLKGWVHNLVDGKVEIVCEGNKEQIGKFIEWCKEGTPLAKIENCEVTYEEYTGEFEDFKIREFGF